MGKLAMITLVSAALIGSRGPAPYARTSEPKQAAGPAVRATLTGRVSVASRTERTPASLSPYARRRYAPPQDPGVPGGAEDAFVYLVPTAGATPAPVSEPVRITQRDRTILPHVALARVGQRVEFPNEDDVFHNLFSLSPEHRFSLGRYPPGDTKTNTFESPGVVRLFCDIHAEMAGVILVVATPHAARVAADGRFSLEGVPAGSYDAVAWHPTAGADTVAVTLREGESTSLDFDLSGRR